MNSNNNITQRVVRGSLAGIIGGVVFGIMMAMMGTLPMIGKMVGVPNAVAGFLVHLAISASIGGSFGVFLGGFLRGRGASLAGGLLYGSFWWLLGPLTLMPLFMGMGLGVNWNATAAQAMLPSLMGHAIFGLVMGFAWSRGENCLPLKLLRKSGSGDEPAPRRVI